MGMTESHIGICTFGVLKISFGLDTNGRRDTGR